MNRRSGNQESPHL